MVAVTAAAFAIGLLAIAPMVAVAPLVVLAASILLLEGRARLPFLVFGGLAALQSSQDVNLLKVAYLAGVGIAVVGAVLRLQQPGAAEGVATAKARPLILVSGLFLVMIGLSFPVAIAYGTSPDAWLRDGSAYLLFAAAIVVGVDARASYSPRAIVWLLVIAGLVSTLSFTVQWVGSGWRGLADLPLQRLVLASFFLPAAIFTYASVRSMVTGARASLLWLACAAIVAALMLVTGTRSSLLLWIGPVAGLWFYRRHGHRVRVRLLVLSALLVAASLAGLQLAAIGAGTDPGRLLARFESIGTLVGNPGWDASLLDRLAQTKAGLQSFLSAPITGVGAGHLFRWMDGFGMAHESFILDAPTAFPAKFGLGGVAIAVAAAVLMIRWPGAIAARAPAAAAAWTGFVAIGVTWFLLFGAPWEEKGFSLAVALFVALAQGAGGSFRA
jgi:hypothetical protein